MKKTLHTSLFVLITWTLSSCNQNTTDINTYNNFLGKEKAEAFDKGLTVFDQFLEDNFANQPSQGLQIEAFLKKLIENPNYIGPDTT